MGKSLTRELLTRTSRKYYAAEVIASLLALVLSVASAVLMDRITDSDAAISIVSALGGTLGFFTGTMGLYALLHVRQYRRAERCFARDIKSILSANIRGILAMYAFRIPCQYILQKLAVSPAVAAVIAQGASALIATAVRMHHNYRSQIFGHVAHSELPRRDAPAEDERQNAGSDRLE